MVTDLQRRFCRSRFLRRAMQEIIAEEIGSVKGSRRVINSCIAAAFEQIPEAAIKARLYGFLQCSDLTATDRAEIRRLLDLSSTALTKQQRQQIALFLQEE